MLDLTYDIAEMSLATFTRAREQGVPLVALPLFTGRRFMQPAVLFNSKAGLASPADLRNRRVALPQFWMTSSVWHRLILRQIYGISQTEVHWITTADERLLSLGLPPEATRDTTGRSPQELVECGEAEALMGPGVGGPPRIIPGAGQDAIVPAFTDLITAQREYYERTAIFPVAHCIVMKQELADGDPELVEDLCNTFERAKQLGLPAVLENPATRPIAGLDRTETRRLFGDDPWPYGIAPSRNLLETFLSDALDQGLIHREMAVDELFPATLPDQFQ
ncbi:MAG: hypothetical protein HW416_1091 [Chloroflexi bacterium]|nr:hypothetical protein [Chloroflexota bacterium]